ncbi:MAG: ATP-binding cassette domain-containing protein, partial [Variovorax sp.]
TMSGGEKARLVLAMMVWQRPNLLLLDEPTNHLDLATREALAVALNEFEGTLMLVSHDRALLRSVCDEFWMVGRGAVTDFDGDLDDYQRYLLDEAKRMREEAKVASREAAASAVKTVAAPAPPAGSAASLGKKPNLQPLQREIAKVDEQLALAGKEKSALESRLAESLPPAEIAATGKKLKVVNDEIDRLEERWMALSGELEALVA